MTNSQMSYDLHMHWVPVVDEHGHTRMEARWELLEPHAAPAQAA